MKLPFNTAFKKKEDLSSFSSHESMRKYLVGRLTLLMFVLLLLLSASLFIPLAAVFASQFGLFNSKLAKNTVPAPVGKTPTGLPEVLAEFDDESPASTISPRINFNIPTNFSRDVYVQGDLLVQGRAVLPDGIEAPNVIYEVNVGPGIEITGDQVITLVNAGVLSIAGETGDIELEGGTGIEVDGLTINNTGVTAIQGQTGDVTFTAGTGITISGTTISANIPDIPEASNAFSDIEVDGQDTLSAGANDTLTIEAGSGITLKTDSSTKTLTITSAAGSTPSGWTDNGAAITLTDISDSVGIGTAAPGSKLHVVGDTTLDGNVNISGTITFAALANGIIRSTGGVLSSGTVALGTDTSGDYVASVGSGNGINVTGGTGVGSTPTADLGALSADWNQSGAFDISLNNAGAEIKILESAGDTFFGILDVGNLTADRTYTLPDLSGEVCLSTGNCAGSGSGIGGSGTAGRTARFQGAFSVENGSINDLYAGGVQMTIDAAGEVGIGTTNPLYTLDVAGSVKVGDGSAFMLGQGVSDPVGAPDGALYYRTTDDRFRCKENGAWKFCDTSVSGGSISGGGTTGGIAYFDSGSTITSATGFVYDEVNGRLGIGTSSPTVALDVNGNFVASGTVSASNLSGTNTGDQTISLTGDIVGSGTGTFGTVIQANAVALGTDTTGNYVATATGGSGISVSGSGSESAAVSLALGALTADWQQTGAFDVILDNADSQLQIKANVGNFYGIFDVDTLTANRTYTFPDATGEVCLDTGNCSSVGGGVTVSTAGTDNRLARFSGAQTVENSSILDDYTGGVALTISVGGDVSAANNLSAVGTVTGSNLSGTNTGDQTIILTGDVTGSGTGSFATTIQPNSVALGTDTTGNYVATIASGNGVAVSGSGSESAAVSLALGALTADWNQTGAFDISLNNAGAELKILESTGNTFFGIIDVGNLAADRTYTFPDATGTVCLDTGNCAGAGGGVTATGYADGYLTRFTSSTNEITASALYEDGSGNIGLGTSSPGAKLDVVGNIIASGTITGSNLSGTNTGDQTISLTGDVVGSGTGSFATVIQANAVALGTDTTGNYVATATGGSGISVSGSGSESAAVSFALAALTADWSQTGAFDIILDNADSQLQIRANSGSFYGTFDVDTLTANRTYTFPDASGEVCLDSGNCVGAGGGVTATGYADGYLTKFTSNNNEITTSELFEDGSGNIGIGNTAPSAKLGVTGNINASGTITGSNLSGTNTGDQTITLTGDVAGTGTGSFATTIQPNAVTLGTDTTGNYIATIASGNGVAVSGSGSESAAASLALGALTADWNQTGAFDISLNNAGSELKILESTGDTFFGIIDVGNLTADRTYTFPDATGTVCLDSGNCAGSGGGVTTAGGTSNALAKFTGSQTIGDSILSDNGSLVSVAGALTATGNVTGANLSGTNTGDQTITLTGDVVGSGTGSFATTIQANSVALGTDTTGNYVATVAGGSGIAVTGSGSESAAVSLALTALTADWSQSGAFDIILDNIDSQLQIRANSGAFYGTFDIGTLTANRTYTFPDDSGVVCLDSGNCAGAGGGVTTTGGTSGRVARFSDTQELEDSSINDLGNALAISIDASENVGIGTSATAAKLTVGGNISTTGNVAATGTVTGSNLSGTNTGDQTISLTGDIVGSGTGSFATTIQANAVALGTDTTGNYIATIASGNGVSASGSGSESAAVTLALSALTADWQQTGAFDVILDNADSQLQIRANTGAFYGIFDVDTLTANRTYTFPDEDGTVCLDSGNCAGAGGGVTATGYASGYLTKFTSTSNQITVSALYEDGSGNIGIGNTAPGAKLGVTGNITASGTITGSNLSGTNTGDQTISLTGDVVGSGTGSFATTIQANSVALGTDTTGNYVATVTGGSGIAVTGSGSESAAVSLALTALTADWNQTGAFDISLNNAGSELKILESTGDTFFGIIDVGNLTADRTYTFPDADGEICLDSGNCAGSGGGVTTAGGTSGRLARFSDTQEIEDSSINDLGNALAISIDSSENVGIGTSATAARLTVGGNISTTGNVAATGTVTGSNLSGTNTGDQTISLTGDIVGSGTGTFATTIQANAVALGTDTTGNYVATIASGNGVAVTGSGSESAAVSLALGALTADWDQTGAFDVILNNASSELAILESAGDTFFGIVDVGNLTADRTYTFPDADGEICLDSGNCAGAGGGVTTAGGTSGRLARFSAAQVLEDSSINDAGSAIAITINGSGNVGIGDTNPLTKLAVGGAIAATGNISAGGNLSATGTVTGSNLSGTNTGDQTITLTGDVVGSGTGSFATTIQANSVALGTDTTGNYLATLASGSGIDVTGSGSESAAVSLALGALTADWSQTGAFDIILDNADSQLQIRANSGAFYGTFDVGTLTANRTYTAPDASGTLALLQSTQTFTGVNSFTNAGGITLGEDLATNTAGKINLISAGANAFSTTIQTGTQTQNVTYTLPVDDGDNNFLLATDGNGVLSWKSVSGAGGGTGTITAVGNVTTGDAFTAAGTAGTSLWFYDPDGRGQVTTANLTAARTYTFPDETGTVCLTSGNCSGSGGGVTTLGGTSNTLAKFTGSQSLGDSIITDDGATVGVGGDLTATGAITGSNLSGTNTGDQTITLTGDVAGTGTGSFATTIQANSVALGTDTTGNYVATVAGGSGIAVTGSGSESAAVSLALTALTADWDQTGAFDISLNNAGSELKILESAGDTFFGIIDVGNLTADRTYTFPDATGTVCLSTGNCAGAGAGVTATGYADGYITKFTSTTNQITVSALYEDGSGNIGIGNTAPAAKLGVTGNIVASGTVTGSNLSGTNTGDQTITLTGDVAGTGTGSFATTIQANAVTLATDTTGNYVATIATGNGVSVSGSGSENASVSLAIGALTADWDQTGAFDISLNNAGSELKILESAGDTYFGIIDVGNLTADRTYTFPDATGTVCLSTGNCAGAGTGVTATGYADGYITKFTSTSNQITASALFEDGSGNIGIGNTAPGAKLGVTGNIVASGTVTGSNLSGTNTGDQTISLTGDVVGSGTGSFATTIQANSVALGTDTTGNYVATVAGGSGIAVTGSGSESAAVSLALTALTADWNQTGAFDIILNNADSQLQIRADSGAFYGIFNVDTLTADRTYTFPDADGEVCLDSGNCASSGGGVTTAGGTSNTLAKFTGSQTLGNSIITDNGTTVAVGGVLTATGNISGANLSGTNTGDQTITLTGDVTGSGTGSFATTIAANSVALATDTTGNYVATIASGNGVSVSGSGSENASVSLALGALTADWNQTGAFDISLNNAASELKILESTGDTFFGIIDVGNLTADRTYTFPDATGEVCLDSGNCAGSGGGVTTAGGTSGRLARFSDTQELEDSSINDAGSAVAVTIDGSGNVGIGDTSPAAKLEVGGNIIASGTITGSNLSGTNTGDQTITLTGDVTGSGTGSFGTTIAANAVALGTDTTGNYVATATGGSGISVSGSGSESAAVSFALAALTADWSQTGAFDILLANAGSELRIMESAGDTFYGALDVTNLTADRTYTFPDASGTVCLSSGNCAGAGGGVTSTGYADGFITRFTSTTNEITSSALYEDGSGNIGLGNTAPGAKLDVTGNIVASGTVTGSNLSGTNTGDQTITLTGDVAGTGTGSFATTIQANAVTLATDTTGNYVATIASGNGVSVSGSGSENASVSLALGALTSDWSQTGAFDIILDNADSQLQIRADSGAFYGIFNVDTLTANRTYTYPDESGEVCLSSGNCAGSGGGVTTGGGTTNAIAKFTSAQVLGDSILSDDGSTVTVAGALTATGNITAANLSGTNTGDQTISLTGDVVGSGTGSFATTIQANSVALGTDTTGNYVATVAGGSGIAVTGSGSESAAVSLALTALTADWNQTGAFDISLNNAGSELKILESTGDTFFGIIDVGNLTADRTYTFPDATGTVCLDTGNCAGSGGGVTTAGGTSNTLAKFTGSQTLGDSILTDDGSTVTVGGILTATGNITGANLSGTNTGDQTITLTGDVTGSGTGSFGTTIAANAVALGTDTTGNYVATIASGNGVSVSGSGSETAAVSLALGALTADWTQTGAFDIILDNADSQLQIRADSGAFYGIFNVDTLTANRTYTFPDADGEVCLDSGNCASSGGGVTTVGGTSNTLAKFTGAQTIGDSIITDDGSVVTVAGDFTATGAISGSNLSGTNTGDQTISLTGDVVGSGTGSFATTIQANSVALGTDTTGNYVATLASGNGVAVTGSGSESAAVSLALSALTADWDQTGAFDIILNNASSELSLLESAGATFFGTIDVGNLTANRTYTFPDATGIVCLDTGNCAGSGGGVTTAGGTTNRLAKFTAGQVIGDSTIDDLGDALAITINSSENVGIGTSAPGARLDSLSTTEQLRLSYNASNYSSFTISSGGDLTIAPSGGDTSITGTLTTSSNLTVNAQGDVRYADSDSTNWAAIQAPATIASNYTLTLPDNDGSAANEVLVTDGSGILSWASLSGLGAGGDITAVGSMTTGAVFADSTADDDWIGLGAAAGRIEFDDQTIDEINFLSTNVGIGTTAPTLPLQVYSLGFNSSSQIVPGAAAGSNDVSTGLWRISSLQTGNHSQTLTIQNRNMALTSGTGTSIDINPTINPSSGTMNANVMLIDPVVNQTGGANGITRSIYINPTLTAAADYRSLEIGNNSGYGIYQSGASALNYFAGNLGIGVTSPSVALDISGNLQLRAQGDARFADSDSSNYVAVQSPTTVGSNYTLTLPNAVAGGANYALVGNTSGDLSWLDTSTYGDITAVGSMTAGAAFSDSTADDDWLGLGSTAGRIEFDDQATDEINILSARLGIGTTAPAALTDFLATTEQLRLSYDVSNYSSFTVGSSGDLTIAPTGTDTNITGALAVSTNVSTLAQGDLRLSDSDSSNYAAIQSPTTIGTDYTLTLPDNDGTAAGQALVSDGNGVLSWSTNPMGDITAVGSMTVGDAFSDSTADDDWLGLGSTAGRIEFDDQATDEINFLSANVGIGTTAPTSTLDVVSTATTTNAFALTANSLTSGYAQSITSTSTGLTTGRLFNVEWNPASAATATGDLARLSINSFANIGNFLNIVDNNSSIFSISETAVTTSLPTSFTAPGDLSVSYDLAFTNQTVSTIRSNASLAIEVGETWESNDLTLQTYNAGRINLLGGTSGAVTVGTSGTGLNFSSNTNNTGGFLVSTAAGQGNITGGAYYNGSNWIATHTGASIIENNSGAITFYGNTSLTAGSSFTPTARGNVSTTGAWTFGSGVTGGTTTLDIGGTGTTSAVCHSGGATATNDVQLVDCTGAPAADYMEFYSVEYGIETGDILMPSASYITTTDGDRVAKLTKTTSAYQKVFIGVASDIANAGDFNAIGYNINEADNPYPVALNGRVMVKVSPNSPAIEPGDYITSSNDAGRGMKASKAGFMVGKALEAWTPGSGKDKVMVFISYGYADPTNAVANFAIDENGYMSAPKIKAEQIALGAGANDLATIIDTQTNTISQTSVSLANLATVQTQVNDRMNQMEQSIATMSAALAQLNTGDVTNVASIEAGLASLDQRTTAVEEQVASISAKLNDLVIGGIASKSGTIATDSAQLDELIVSGNTNLNDLGVTGIISAGNLMIEGLDAESESSINTLGGTLKIQSIGLNNIEFEAGKIVMDTNGNMSIDGSIKTSKVKIDTSEVLSASAGKSIIPAGVTFVEIDTTAVKANSLIFVTATTKTGQVLSVSNQIAGTSFRVNIPTVSATAIDFNWWIVDEE